MATSVVQIWSRAHRSLGTRRFLSIAIFLRTATVFGLATRWARERALTDLVLLVCFVLIEVVIGLLSAVKESFVITLLAAVIPIALARRRGFPWLGLLAALDGVSSSSSPPSSPVCAQRSVRVGNAQTS